ncbi:hypothetical protein CATMIT_01695, partial [Catenibacterium mitsuokai DSM 15897]
GVGLLGARQHVGVVAHFHAGLERQRVGHLDQQAQVVAGVGVVAAGFDQQGVVDRGGLGELVAEVDEAARDGLVLVLAQILQLGPAIAGADFEGQVGVLVLDRLEAVADRGGPLVFVGGEVVALVARRTQHIAARAQAIAAAAEHFVAARAFHIVLLAVEERGAGRMLPLGVFLGDVELADQ